MSTPRRNFVVRNLAMGIVTVAATLVMIASSTNWIPLDFLNPPAPAAVAEGEPLVRSPVTVQVARRERVELTQTYSGMIHPFEKYTLGFENPGRIDALGLNAQGATLDEGDAVSEGQLLASLDQQIFAAQAREAEAQLRRAKDELDRAVELRQTNPRAISEAVMATRETDHAIAQARADQARKRLADATLKAPVSGVISRRMVKAGESIGVHQPVFEIVQVDKVLLVVNVPESQVQTLVARQQEVELARLATRQASSAAQPSDTQFRVYVDLVSETPRGEDWPTLVGEVYSISATSREASGMFEVEILLENAHRQLRPGQIAVARLVTGEIHAYRLPVDAAVFDDQEAYLFSVVPQTTEVDYLFWTVAQAEEYTARRIPLERGDYLEAGSDLIVFDLPADAQMIVVRGQHRLVAGRPVVLSRILAPPRPAAPLTAGTASTGDTATVDAR